MIIYAGFGFYPRTFSFLGDMWAFDVCICGLSCNDFFGGACNIKCIDYSCNINCTCDPLDCDQDSTYCNGSITIENQITSFSSNYIVIHGNININQSLLNLTSIELFVDNDLTLTNSSFIFDSSTISVSNCVDLINVSITVDLSQFSNASKEENIVLLNSSKGCLKAESYTIAYLNQPKCSTVKNEINDYSLTVVFNKVDCETIQQNQHSNETWIILLIAIASVVGIAIIFIIIALVIPSLRTKIFPYRYRTPKISNIEH